MTLSDTWRQVLAGAAIVLLVFLPVYLVALAGQLFLRMAEPSSADFMDHFAGAVITYVGLSLTALGGVVHGSLVALFPHQRSRLRQIAAVVSAPVVPATMIAGDLPGAIFLSALPLCTAIATVCHGIAYAHWLGRQAEIAAGDKLLKP